MGMKKKHKRSVKKQVIIALILGTAAQAQNAPLMPLPGQIHTQPVSSNPAMDITDKLIGSIPEKAAPEIPSAIAVENNGGDIQYDSDKHLISYDGAGKSIRMRSDKGADIISTGIKADMANERAILEGPLTMYQNEILIKASGGGHYDWQKGDADIKGVRAKVNGLIVRGSRVEYKTDAKGKNYVVIHDAYVSTDDSETPSTWIGTGTLTVYPGDYGRISRLSISGSETDLTVPILGWFSFSHSLNPREGYMPNFGTRSSQGVYFLNSYGVLFGNRRVEGLMPTADYLWTTHLDYRTRRGLAVGIDLEDIAMTKKHGEMAGLQLYYAADSDPMINPQRQPRQQTDHERYRVAMQAQWDVTPSADYFSKWLLTTNVNVLSDRYLLRDFFEDISKLDNKPDNTVRIERTSKRTHAMVYTRFAPNDFYATDERLEGSFYRVRTALGNSGITYETRNSAGIMRQYLPTLERIDFQNKLAHIKDDQLREYYTRQLNTDSFARVNTTHEFTTNFKVLKFLNITPKGGFGYTGYYDVGGVGPDNRFMGYLGCDFDIKFHNHYPNFSYKRFGLKGLTHVIHPYASYSQASISSSNPLVPQIDTWSSTLGASTCSPMPLDLSSFTGIDGWGSWSIWRLGVQNVINSYTDGERVRLINWNAFIDYNVDNPNTETRFSNVYSTISLHPSDRFTVYLDSQTPTFRNGDGFELYSLGISYMPTPWLETYLSYRNINNHPIQGDSEQVRIKANLRINEKYTASLDWDIDSTEGTMPIQQYSIFRNAGAWYIGATYFIRDNNGKKEHGLGISFTLGETGTALPIDVL